MTKSLEKINNFWINHSFKNEKPIDKKIFQEKINWLYSQCNLNPPEFIYTKNLFEQLDYPVTGPINEVISEYIEKNIFEVGRQKLIDAKVFNPNSGIVDPDYRDIYSFNTTIRDKLSHVFSVITSRTRKIQKEYWNQKKQNIFHNSLSLYGSLNYDMISTIQYYDFFVHLHMLKFEELNNLITLFKSNFFLVFFYEKRVLALGMPKIISFDENFLLHNEKGPAIKWDDSCGFWYEHGKFIKTQLSLTN